MDVYLREIYFMEGGSYRKALSLATTLTHKHTSGGLVRPCLCVGGFCILLFIIFFIPLMLSAPIVSLLPLLPFLSPTHQPTFYPSPIFSSSSLLLLAAFLHSCPLIFL